MSQEYFNQKAGIWDRAVAEKDGTKLESLARRLELRPGSSVLDVGTGTGVLLPFLLDVVGESGRIVALDFAEQMLRQARAKQDSGQVAYVLADISRLPARPESFDAVVCYSSFPHFPDKPRTLAGVCKALKPGGRLFICHTSSRDVINRTHSQIPAVQDDLLPEEVEMRSMLGEAGFAEITIDDGPDSYLAVCRKSSS